MYHDKKKEKPLIINAVSKFNMPNGEKICFFSDGNKIWHVLYKNGSKNGISKQTYGGKNWFFENYKKGKLKGIDVKFKL